MIADSPNGNHGFAWHFLAAFLALKMHKADHSYGQAQTDAYLHTVPRRRIRRLDEQGHVHSIMRLFGRVYTESFLCTFRCTKFELQVIA